MGGLAATRSRAGGRGGLAGAVVPGAGGQVMLVAVHRDKLEEERDYRVLSLLATDEVLDEPGPGVRRAASASATAVWCLAHGCPRKR